MQHTRRVIVIHSPHSGRSTQLTQALTYLQQTQTEIVTVLSIAELDSLPAQGPSWQDAGIDCAIAAGGDGLVGGVINHIATCGLPLGILPLGTANDIARSLNIPQELRAAAETIAHGKISEIDIGAARPAEQAPLDAASGNYPSPDQHGFFAHALTVGLNVQFARLATNVATRQRYGRMTYPYAAFEVMKSHTPLEMHCTFEGLLLLPHNHSFFNQSLATPSTLSEEPVHLSLRALQATIINAPIFGGQWSIALPGASLTDRLLDIVVIEDVELGRLNTIFTHLFNQQELHTSTPSSPDHPPHMQQAELTGIPGIHHVQARGVTITTHADPQDVTLDGEIRGRTPTHVHMAEQRLRVIVP